MMETILYRIPNEFSPGVIIKKPFHAKVNYKVIKGKVELSDVCISPLCMEHIINLKGLRMRMQEDIQIAEDRTVNGIHPVIENVLRPFMPHI